MDKVIWGDLTEEEKILLELYDNALPDAKNEAVHLLRLGLQRPYVPHQNFSTD